MQQHGTSHRLWAPRLESLGDGNVSSVDTRELNGLQKSDFLPSRD